VDVDVELDEGRDLGKVGVAKDTDVDKDWDKADVVKGRASCSSRNKAYIYMGLYKDMCMI
jgi:hypothetical protein